MERASMPYGQNWVEDPVYGYDLGPELLGSHYTTHYDESTDEWVETYYEFDGLLPVEEFRAARRRGEYRTYTIRKKRYEDLTPVDRYV
jgi:hypothetical protein